mmetsp:Transcript_32594/g.45227  ORF Transcript_32594/g.45227 Transcript_32594/m.45227 type:complete len:249 (-) Transcript_32594:181-927(-)
MANIALHSISLSSPRLQLHTKNNSLAGKIYLRHIQSKTNRTNKTTLVSNGLHIDNEPSATRRKQLERRHVSFGVISGFLFSQVAGDRPSFADEELQIIEETEGGGATPTGPNSLVLLHFVGTVSGTVFDSTRGGQQYLNGGEGVFRPAIIQANSSSPVPGICEGLQKGLVGMRAGSKRTIRVPPSLGFGTTDVFAPYARVPANSELTYKIEVLRVSNSGPDDLMRYINLCGAGGAGEQESGCKDIVPL